MKILILTQYFPPETGAAQNRLFELAVRLKSLGADITVLTAMPNYPQMQIYDEYEGLTYVYEEIGGLKVHRSSIYVSSDRSVISRLKNYFSFVLSSWRTTKKKLGRFDVILCESPPLFLGYTAMWLARRMRAKLIFNVSDLWPETAEKLGVITNRFLLDRAYVLEEKIYRRSALVTGQTQGICRSIDERFPEVRTYWLPNGVDLDYYDPAKIDAGDWRSRHKISKDDIVFLYAGILGIGQGLEVILKAAERHLPNRAVRFVLLGDGPEKNKLLALKDQLRLDNVLLLDPVPKKEMPSILKSCNATIIPLKKIDLYKGAIPSKAFECMGMQLPILLGVDGEARELFIDNGKCGLYFEPENEQELADAVEKLASSAALRDELGSNGRRYVAEHFNRDRIAQSFFEELEKL